MARLMGLDGLRAEMRDMGPSEIIAALLLFIGDEPDIDSETQISALRMTLERADALGLGETEVVAEARVLYETYV